MPEVRIFDVTKHPEHAVRDHRPVDADASAGAQPALATAAAPTLALEGRAVSDIIVMTRRNAGTPKNVPVSEAIIRGDLLQKLSITAARDRSKFQPDLNISADSGIHQAVTLRGVTCEPGPGTPAIRRAPKEMPFDPASTISPLLDGGQIEVLRGPPGTARGALSISGVITITTKRPDPPNDGG